MRCCLPVVCSRVPSALLQNGCGNRAFLSPNMSMHYGKRRLTPAQKAAFQGNLAHAHHAAAPAAAAVVATTPRQKQSVIAGPPPPASRLPWDDDLRVCVSLGALDAALRSVGYKRTTNTRVRIESLVFELESWPPDHLRDRGGRWSKSSCAVQVLRPGCRELHALCAPISRTNGGRRRGGGGRGR